MTDHRLKNGIVRPFFAAFNRLFALLVQSRLPSRWLFLLFAYVLPVPVTNVRGVRIKTAIPIHHVGIHQTIKNWERREPGTLDWIDSMTPSDVLLDIGSSFGTETLYAAKKPGGPHRVLAIDPGLMDMFVLAHNLTVNAIGKVDIYVVAVGNQNATDQVLDSV